MARHGLTWASIVAAVLIVVAVVIAVVLLGGRDGPRQNAAVPSEEVSSSASTAPSRIQAQESATAEPATKSTDAESPDSPEEEEEIVLVDPLMGAGMDPALAEVMPDFARVLGKDDILPIYDPVMVSAEEAGLKDDDHVMGLAIDGEARAYPVRELFSREMVNDEVAGVPVLVTW